MAKVHSKEPLDFLLASGQACTKFNWRRTKYLQHRHRQDRFLRFPTFLVWTHASGIIHASSCLWPIKILFRQLFGKCKARRLDKNSGAVNGRSCAVWYLNNSKTRNIDRIRWNPKNCWNVPFQEFAEGNTLYIFVSAPEFLVWWADAENRFAKQQFTGYLQTKCTSG